MSLLCISAYGTFNLSLTLFNWYDMLNQSLLLLLGSNTHNEDKSVSSAILIQRALRNRSHLCEGAAATQQFGSSIK